MLLACLHYVVHKETTRQYNDVSFNEKCVNTYLYTHLNTLFCAWVAYIGYVSICKCHGLHLVPILETEKYMCSLK